jgi:hypothetical protein
MQLKHYKLLEPRAPGLQVVSYKTKGPMCKKDWVLLRTAACQDCEFIHEIFRDLRVKQFMGSQDCVSAGSLDCGLIYAKHMDLCVKSSWHDVQCWPTDQKQTTEFFFYYRGHPAAEAFSTLS